MKSVRSANNFFRKPLIKNQEYDNNDDLLLEQLKNRRPFTVDYETNKEGIYTEDYFHSKISSHLLTNPDNFSKKFKLDQNIEIPDEQTIKDEYRFKFPVLISNLENENTLAAHVLATMKPNIEYIEVILIYK